MNSLDIKIGKRNRAVIFVIIYCLVLLALLIGLKIAEFKISDTPLETAKYIYTPGSSQKLLININTADLHQLCQLPQIGETLAQRIIDHRRENGLFGDIQDIKRVNGIGDIIFEKISDLITVG